MNITIRFALIAAMIAITTACQPVMPESLDAVPSAVMEAAGGLQRIVVTYSNEGITVDPPQVNAGPSTIMLTNDGDTVLGGPFGRFREGNSVADFVAAAPSPGGMAALSLLDTIGGVPVDPQGSQEVIVELQAGEHLFLAADGKGEMMLGSLQVVPATGGEVAGLPTDVSITLSDFAYEAPSVIPAGENVWHLRNEGSQLHEMIIAPIEAGSSLESAAETIRAIGSPFAVLAGTSPVEVAFLYGPVSPGVDVRIPLALEPGSYAIGTLLPDMTTLSAEGGPTALLDRGMIAIVSVK